MSEPKCPECGQQVDLWEVVEERTQAWSAMRAACERAEKERDEWKDKCHELGEANKLAAEYVYKVDYWSEAIEKHHKTWKHEDGNCSSECSSLCKLLRE